MNCNKLAKTVTKAGIILIESGAETNRVEDTMVRLCKAFGASVIDAYVTPTLLIISFSYKDELVHNIKRVHIKETNLNKIDMVNALSRQVCNNEMDFDIFNEALDLMNDVKPYSLPIKLLGAAICTFGFTYFFKGSLLDAIFALLIGVITQGMVILFDRLHISSTFKYFISGAILTLSAILSAHFFHISRDLVIISSIMLLVPGLAITNAIKDSVNGDLVSGLTRGAESILIAMSIAIGSGICLILLGGF